jgi:hypothetical protein
MSADNLLNLALFAGAMLMRFGSGAHVMSHTGESREKR